MSATRALEKLVKLAIRRHTDGIPDYIICFDTQGDEVSWADVSAASPKGKQGELETVTPTPGMGYFCDIVLKGLNASAEGERQTFLFRSPNFQQSIEFIQPTQGAGYLKHGPLNADASTIAVLEAIDKNL